jgi:hypothetical protein
MPSLGVSCAPLKDIKKLKLSATAAYMDAPEDDGPGDGTERGWLYKFLGEFTIGQGMLTAKDSLTGYLLIDILDPGDYYADTDSTAFFARWQINYAF